ncbi:hypothetical protein [Streptomyces daliensis]
MLATLGASVLIATMPAMSARADDQSAQAYVQECTNIGNGTLCIDINGSVGTNGVIGVGYWKHAGSPVEVRLGWQNTTGGGANMFSPHYYVEAGGGTPTRVSHTYLAAGCVFPILEVNGSQVIHGEKACVPS